MLAHRKRTPGTAPGQEVKNRVENKGGMVMERVKLVSSAGLLLLVFGLIFNSSFQVPDFVSSRLRTISRDKLNVATWNIAAINNNPFEYWLTLENDHYYKLMAAMETMVTKPAENDVLVNQIITQRMVEDLAKSMRKLSNFEPSAIDKMLLVWKNDYSQRKIISGFLRDDSLGDKRLTSMPDRITNTLDLSDGRSAFRPTVINCFDGKLDSVAGWWDKWRIFMFEQKLNTVKSGSVIPAEMLSTIPRAKYPSLTVEEEKMSVPLQTLAMAIMDGILVHIMTLLDERLSKSGGPIASNNWQDLRREICQSLNLKKNERVLEILSSQYGDRDVIFLQEVAGAFINEAKKHPSISETFRVVTPLKRSKSNQNSVILLSRERFPAGVMEDITVRLKFDDPKMIAAGDIVLVRASDMFNTDYVLGSFHGDTNGLATIPLTKAVARVLQPNEELVMGLDANTYTRGVPGKKQGVIEYGEAYTSFGLDSCWGPVPNPHELTTYNARTYLQPQLNKASNRASIREKGDTNPKDFILFRKDSFLPVKVSKDNTGRKSYEEEMVFPTMKFPSDHGILSSDLIHQGERNLRSESGIRRT